MKSIVFRYKENIRKIAIILFSIILLIINIYLIIKIRYKINTVLSTNEKLNNIEYQINNYQKILDEKECEMNTVSLIKEKYFIDTLETDIVNEIKEMARNSSLDIMKIQIDGIEEERESKFKEIKIKSELRGNLQSIKEYLNKIERYDNKFFIDNAIVEQYNQEYKIIIELRTIIYRVNKSI
ncbi:MAG: hypothetical protein Q4P31_02605 [Andreesenia angusta]|nr:hypothetical protein [Andreesenia angusta]